MFIQKETLQSAWPKIKYYCAFQERAHQEVRNKLYEYGLHKVDVELHISRLIEENYLNEERFAIQFAGGKFRMKHWGKIKIQYELKAKGVGEYVIKNALKTIPASDYERTIEKLADQKFKTLKSEKNHLIRKKKMQDFLLQKGYERSLIISIISKITAKENK
ncbi:MAG: regulatory protein RecX [Ginsengibacter sp.]